MKRGVRKKDLLVVVLFLLALWVAYEWRTIAHFYVTTQAYLWQRRCMAHALPPGTIVYSEEPAEIRRLLADPRYFRLTADGPATYDPPALRQMEQWRQEAGTVPHGRGPYGGVFLHGRSASGIGERLVGVSVLPFAPGGVTAPRSVSFYGVSVVPGTLTRFWELGPNTRPFALQLGASDQLTIFAGQPDPADPSHFTIAYTLNGRAGTIDGWLGTDGTVDLRPREGSVGWKSNSIAPVWQPPASPATAPTASTAPVAP